MRAAEKVSYELWDVDTNNMVAGFAAVAEAVAFVRRAIAERSAQYLDDLVLVEVNQFGHSREISRGRGDLHRFAAYGRLEPAGSL